MNHNKHDLNGKIGECPKRVFWLLPRPAKPARTGEDPSSKLTERRASPRSYSGLATTL